MPRKITDIAVQVLPKVSIIVPCFNVEGSVANCLGTIQDQNFTDFEVICVDDGSTDDTVKRIEPFLIDARFRLISQENRGLGGARNTGIRHAKGKYITFIDSDDWVLPTFLEKLVKLAELDNLDVVDTLHLELNSDGVITRKRHEIDFGHSNYFEKQINGKAPPNACCRLYRRSLLTENNLFFLEKVLHEDMPFTPRVYALARSHKTVPEYLYVWNLNAKSISRNLTANHVENFVRLMLYEHKDYTESSPNDITNYYARLIFYWKLLLEKWPNLPNEWEESSAVECLYKSLANYPQIRLDNFCIKMAVDKYPLWARENIAFIVERIPSSCLPFFSDLVNSQEAPSSIKFHHDPSYVSYKDSLLVTERNISFTYIFLRVLYELGVIKTVPKYDITLPTVCFRGLKLIRRAFL